MKRLILTIVILLGGLLSMSVLAQSEKTTRSFGLSASYNYTLDYPDTWCSFAVDYNFYNKLHHDMFVELNASPRPDDEYISTLYGYRYKFTHEMFSSSTYPFIQFEAGPILLLNKPADQALEVDACLYIGCYRQFDKDRLSLSFGYSGFYGTISAKISYSFGWSKQKH